MSQDEMGRLQNKVALITGAARGHAQTMARRFAAESALLAICDLLPAEELDATTGPQVREVGSRALCFRTDVSDERQVNEMVERTLAEYGHIDILAPVVGIPGPTKDLWDLSLAEWKQVLAVNLDRYNITVNAICPGGHTARDHELAKAFAEYVGDPFDENTYGNYAPGPKPANKVLCGHWLQAEGYVQDHGSSDDAAAMAVFIASDEAGSFTGQDVNTPGGYVMW